MCATRNSRRDKNTLAWPSEAISNVLRSIPDNIKPIITAAEWASTIPKALGLDHEDHRAFFNRLLTWYLINQSDQIKVPIPPRTVRKTLQRKAAQFRGWVDELDSLNSGAELFDARAQILAGKTVAEKKKNARAQITDLQAGLSTLAADLEQAANQLSRDVRRATQKSEVLHHAIYVLDAYLRLHTERGLSRKGLDRLGMSSGNSPADDQRREFAVWLFQKADPKLPRRTILTAAEKAIREIIQTGEHSDFVHETIASVWNR
jgi:hypothetical protein